MDELLFKEGDSVETLCGKKGRVVYTGLKGDYPIIVAFKELTSSNELVQVYSADGHHPNRLKKHLDLILK